MSDLFFPGRRAKEEKKVLNSGIFVDGLRLEELISRKNVHELTIMVRRFRSWYVFTSSRFVFVAE